MCYVFSPPEIILNNMGRLNKSASLWCSAWEGPGIKFLVVLVGFGADYQKFYHHKFPQDLTNHCFHIHSDTLCQVDSYEVLEEMTGIVNIFSIEKSNDVPKGN